MTPTQHSRPQSRSRRLGLVALAAAMLTTLGTGCTSALSTAFLRDVDWGGREHAAETAPPADDEPAADDSFDGSAEPRPTATATDQDPAAVRRAAVEAAAERLSRIETLDEPTQAALVEILQGTPQEDWPTVIDEFTASLAATGAVGRRPPSPPDAVAAAPAPSPEAAAPQPADQTANPPSQPAAEPAAEAPADAPAEPAVAAVEPPAPPPLAVRNACFASRVQAWGVIERFAADRFGPGQDVIVYFELDNLSAAESPAGHTTCIDTVLRLVDAEDRTVHTWTFEPVAETCPSRRRDYFARYVVRIPETVAPGAHRIALAVTDARADTTATATLPLSIAAD